MLNNRVYRAHELKWTPVLGLLAKVCSVVLYRDQWSEYDEITQEV